MIMDIKRNNLMKSPERYNIWLLRILFFLLYSLSGNICSGQYEPLFFDQVTTREGLSQSTVNYILQDHDGFLWFATYNGLNKYDGYSFKVYKKNNIDKTSISSNDIYMLFEDKEGYLWIVNSSKAIDRFNPTTEIFENFSHDEANPGSISSNDIYSVNQDSRGNIWVCAGDVLNLYVDKEDSENKRGGFEKYRNPNSSAAITWVFENRWNQLLIFSDYLFYFDPVKKTLVNTNVRLEDALEVGSVIEDEQGNLLIGTVLNGVMKLEFDKTAGTYRRVDPGKINVTPNRRSRLFPDHNKHVWIGTEEGLYRYIPETDVLECYMPDDLDDRTISDQTIHSLYEDNTGVLWIGTFSHGLNKYDFYRKQFLHFRKIPYKKNSLGGDVISSIHGLDPNELWVGLDVGGGVDRILFSSNQEPEIIHYQYDPEDPNSIGGNSTLCLVQRKNGEVWVGSGGAVISRISPETPFSGQKPIIKRYQLEKWTFAIYEDSDGILWGGTWDMGLWRYNDESEKFDFFIPDSSNKYSICDKVIWSLGEDQHKNIWVGGHGNGISVLTADEKRKASPKFLNFSFDRDSPTSISNNTINAFCLAHDSTFWICTAEGLNKVVNHDGLTGSFKDFPDITFHSYYIADGLPSEGIIGIVEDNNGFIWLSTRNGISKMNPQTEEFINYNEDDGLQSNEFWHNAYFKNANGMIFFGGEKGFNAFYPEKIVINPFVPKVVLTELLLFNKIVKVGESINKQVVLKETISRTDELVLSHKNNIITFQFAALHFAQPSLNKYAYYLKGFEDDWNYTGNQRSATYTNLDPGNYTFRVKASNNDGIWSDKEVALSITISPPWWETLFIKITIPVILVLFVLGIFRIRFSMLKKQKEVLQRTVHMRTEELQEVNTLLEEKQEEIILQNDELLNHRNNLEELVNERTYELEKAKQKAEESDRLKSAFLANMSHEIRTPMNAILGFSSLLNETDINEVEKENFIRTIKSNGEALMVLIDDILDISMIQSNQLVLNPKYFNVNTVLTELEDYYRLKNKHGLSIEFVNSKEKELILYIDPVRFRQIMSNLLSNAYKYTNAGYIRFGYEIKEEEILFFVSDSGIGIDPKYSENIFESFFKIEPQSSQVYRGTGIGLAICRRLVELLKGRIWVESSPGSGSSFCFTIPYIKYLEAVPEEKKKSKEKPALSLENFFFVIAEDEPTNYEILVRVLHIPDDKHFWGKNGKEAVDYIEKFGSHDNLIVLMDIKMPVMDGYKALTLIKQINRKIPVVAVTAFALKHEEEEIMAKGFDGYLSKPILANRLKEIVSRLSAP
jgi:signal transduction histidine kinase/ligand-binding sensor domain-containing protein/CheY-like chemotaxis protein